MGKGKKPTYEKSKHATQVVDVADPSQSRINIIYLLVRPLLIFSIILSCISALIITYGARYNTMFPLPPAMKEFFIGSVILTVLLTSVAWAMQSHLKRQRALFATAIRNQPRSTEQGSMMRQQQMGYVTEVDRELRQFVDWDEDEQVHNLGDIVNLPVDDDDDEDDDDE